MPIEKNKTQIKSNKVTSALKISRHSTVGVLNLGCARNTVDSQIILGRLEKDGHIITDLEVAEVAIVNTCAFVKEAKEESLDAILDLIELKKQGKIKKVIVAGCLSERYGEKLRNELKEVDAFVGVLKMDQEKDLPQISLTPKHYAYVKICESCYQKCSFCVIPKIKGSFSSRFIESIVKEVERLDHNKVKEINLIGQDITAYGLDLYKIKSLVKLLKEIIPLAKNIRWIRLLYTFPAHITEELIDLIAHNEKICSYFDLPLQHINDSILKRMKRGFAKKETIALIRKIRDRIPKVALRTTMIVGFPGETDEDFKELLQFVEETRFDRLGVFKYSREEGTDAYDFPNQVPEGMKQKRYDVLMQAQKSISRNLLKRFLGQSLCVLIDEKQADAKDIYLARSEYDAPEVDGVVHVHSKELLKPGDLVDVTITDSLEYDLVGELT